MYAKASRNFVASFRLVTSLKFDNFLSTIAVHRILEGISGSRDDITLYEISFPRGISRQKFAICNNSSSKLRIVVPLSIIEYLFKLE